MTGSGYAPTDPVTVLTVFFNSRSSTVSASERRKLVRFAKEVAGQGFTTLTVLGHTDGRGEASTASRLAGQRNSAVLNILKKHTKIKFVQRNLGAKRPAESNATAAGQAKNRRVEIMLR
jgi:flagellar motor protein MotB